MGISAKGTLLDPNQTKEVDLEILLEVGETTNKVNIPKKDVAKVSLDQTLSEEGEGDNINGNKELRDLGDNEDENNSKRPKVPLHPPTA